MDPISNKVVQMQKAGYLPIAIFVVPETCWIDYCSIMLETHESFLKKMVTKAQKNLLLGSSIKQGHITNTKHIIAMYLYWKEDLKNEISCKFAA